MADHIWDDATHICTRCAVQKGYQRLECHDATNVYGISHLIHRRHWEREGRMHGLDYVPTPKITFRDPKLFVEYPPKPPPEGA